jgi:hypothetical protein
MRKIMLLAAVVAALGTVAQPTARSTGARRLDNLRSPAARRGVRAGSDAGGDSRSSRKPLEHGFAQPPRRRCASPGGDHLLDRACAVMPWA